MKKNQVGKEEPTLCAPQVPRRRLVNIKTTLETLY